MFLILAMLSGCASRPQRHPSQSALRYVVVGVSGYGTRADDTGEPSGAHQNLPYASGAISAAYIITHSGPGDELTSILQSFECQGGQQGVPELRLIIMANSWGAARGAELARRYQRACGNEVELFVMVDGVRMPLGAYGTRPIARRCVNYYQTRSTAHGRAIEGCENEDLSSRCERGGWGECHIKIEWDGTSAGANVIYELIGAGQYQSY